MGERVIIRDDLEDIYRRNVSTIYRVCYLYMKMYLMQKMQFKQPLKISTCKVKLFHPLETCAARRTNKTIIQINQLIIVLLVL